MLQTEIGFDNAENEPSKVCCMASHPTISTPWFFIHRPEVTALAERAESAAVAELDDAEANLYSVVRAEESSAFLRRMTRSSIQIHI